MITFFLGDTIPNGGVIGATAFFAFVATAVYGADAFFRYRVWKSSTGNADTSKTEYNSQHQEQPV